MNVLKNFDIPQTSEVTDRRADGSNTADTAKISDGVRAFLLVAVGAACFTGCKDKLDRRLERSIPREKLEAGIEAERKLTKSLSAKEQLVAFVEKATKPTRGVVLNSRDMTIRPEDVQHIMDRRFPDGWNPEELRTRRSVLETPKTTEISYEGESTIKIFPFSKHNTVRVLDYSIPLGGTTENITFSQKTGQLDHQEACIGGSAGWKLCYSEHLNPTGAQKSVFYRAEFPVVGTAIVDACVMYRDGELIKCPGFQY